MDFIDSWAKNKGDGTDEFFLLILNFFFLYQLNQQTQYFSPQTYALFWARSFSKISF